MAEAQEVAPHRPAATAHDREHVDTDGWPSGDALAFTAPEGGLVTDGHFRNRVWYPAVEAAGVRVYSTE